MDDLEHSDLEKEKNDSHNTFYRNKIHCRERENAFIKNISVTHFFLSLL